MLLSRATFYRGWSLGLALIATLVTLAQHAPITGEIAWLWIGGLVGWWSEQQSRGIRVFVDVLVGFVFLMLAAWSVAQLCGLHLTLSWGVLTHWMEMVPQPQHDLFPTLLHGVLGVLAWASALSPTVMHASSVIRHDQAEHWPSSHHS